MYNRRGSGYDEPPTSPVTLEDAPGATVDDKLQALLTTGIIGIGLRKLVEDANIGLADEDKFTLEGLPEKLRSHVESTGGEARLQGINFVVFGISHPEDPRLAGASLAVDWICDAGILEKASRRDKALGQEYEVLRLPSRKKQPGPEKQKHGPGRATEPSYDPYRGLEIRDGYYMSQFGYRLAKAPEPVNPRKIEEDALLSEIRAVPPRGRGKKSHKRHGKR